MTPCALVAVQSAVNAVGSFALVAGLHLGLPGVAAATVAGQWLGAVLMLRALCRTPVRRPAARARPGQAPRPRPPRPPGRPAQLTMRRAARAARTGAFPGSASRRHA